MSQPFETMVRVYRSTSEYQRDAQGLARKGWQPTSVTERKPRAGCLRLILLWWLVLIIPPKPELVVTYQRGIGQSAAEALAIAELSKLPGHCPNCGHAVSPTSYFCPNCKANLRR